MTVWHSITTCCDWAVANLLYFHPEARDRLPLDQPAPAFLIRGVELAARMALERHKDDSRWREWIDKVSRGEAHGSWRRAFLLASVRSEIHSELLERVSDFLLGNQARVLRELVRTVMAVDGRAATEFVAYKGARGEQLYVPNGSSWVHLIRWLLSVGENLPAAAIPDVAGLYAGWCVLGVGMLKKIRMFLWLYSSGGRVSPSVALKQYEGLFVSDGDKICNRILKVIRRWLAEIEDSRYPGCLRQLRQPFNGELSSDQVHLLEATLRDSFLTICHIKPSLASDYT